MDCGILMQVIASSVDPGDDARRSDARKGTQMEAIAARVSPLSRRRSNTAISTKRCAR
jgi:hypothetical protein